MEKENKSQFYNFLKIKQRFNNIGQVWHSTSFLEKRNKKEIYLGAFPFILTPYIISSLLSHFDHFISRFITGAMNQGQTTQFSLPFPVCPSTIGMEKRSLLKIFPIEMFSRILKSSKLLCYLYR